MTNDQTNMTTTLTYGKNTTRLLESAEATHLRPLQGESIPCDQIAAQVRAQLAEPLHYPPLAQATVPGDAVVLAIEPGIPQQLRVIEGALIALQDAGVEETLVTILLAGPATNVETLQAELAALGHGDCQICCHDPDDEKETAFLGVTQAGLALRLNRVLCEADLVLPVTVATGRLSPENHLPEKPSPIFAGLFPVFSDRETQKRFSAAHSEQFPDFDSACLAETEEAGRQLGVGIGVHVVPGPCGQVAALFAGDPLSVARQADEKYREVWQSDSSVRGNLVIAALAGEAEQQTWQNLGRALAAAEAVLEPGGCIAICSELADPPGLALSQLFGNDDYQVVAREIQQNPGTDSGPAMQLCRSLERGTVYLISQLSPSVVESLGITPLESDSELEHLAQTLRPCLVLEEAQRLLPSLVGVEA